MKSSRFAIAACAAVVLSFTSFVAGADTIYVSPTGNDDNDGLTPETAVKSLRVAVAKNTKDVTLLRGHHLCDLSLGGVMTSSNFSGGKLRGETDNPRDTVLDFDGTSGCLVNLASTYAFDMSNMTCSNAVLNKTVLMNFGSSANQSVKVVISNCVFTCNSLTNAPSISSAVMCIGSKVLVTDCLFEGNSTVAYSPAITTRSGGRIENCIFRKTRARTPPALLPWCSAMP